MKATSLPMGNFLSHALTLIEFLPTGYAGNGYPLPSLDARSREVYM
jgi:hypothetical protein